MASVPLDFLPPIEDNVVELRIFESPTSTGTFSEIERVTSVGTYPNYISRYTTALALAVDDWFAIQWVDDKGAVGPMSNPIKGGTTSLVSQIIQRVRERDSSLDENVVAQEAEGVIQWVLGDNVDPYDPDLSVSYRQLNGMTYLVMARAYTVQAVTTSGGAIDSATMGLVSFKNSSGSTSKIDVGSLIDLANRELGIATSFVLQLEEISQSPYIVADFSRLTSGWLSIDT